MNQQSAIRPSPGRSARQETGNPGSGSGALRWARRWPQVTASVIGLVVWFATAPILDTMVPAAAPAIGWLGLLLGVVIGTPLAGLKGSRGWVAVPVTTLALACVVGGILSLSGVRLP